MPHIKEFFEDIGKYDFNGWPLEESDASDERGIKKGVRRGYHSPMTSFGGEIIQKRLEMNLTPGELAEKLRITREQLADIELGNVWPYEAVQMTEILEEGLELPVGSLSKALLEVPRSGSLRY